MLCYYCMKDKGDADVCGFCGHTNDLPTEHHQLKPGTVLGQKYVIGRVLGEGGFGITYIGIDSILKIRVAIKEYFPHGYSVRDSVYSNEVSTGSGSKDNFYHDGLQRFLEEARKLAGFSDEPGIVNVRDFFEENNTAYIVMDYLEGVDLRRYLNDHGVLQPEEAFRLLRPAMQSLEAVHRAGIIHRDISPDNIMVLTNGKLKLMDFGAAREYESDNRSLSVMLKKGYAPEEQYHRKGEQGPWSDVYSICATIYRCITGKVPEESLDRVFNDTLARPSQLGVAISPALENVLMYGLEPHKNNRCQNMTELMHLIDEAMASGFAQYPAAAAVPVNVRQAAPAYDRNPYHTNPPEDRRTYGDPYSTMISDGSYGAYRNVDPSNGYYRQPQPEKKGKTGLIILIITAILLIAVLAGVIIYLLRDKGTDPEPAPEPETLNESLTPDASEEPSLGDDETIVPTEEPTEAPEDGYHADENGFPAYYENGQKKSHLGVDVSAYQDNVDFEALKDQGVEFVIIRLGYRSYDSGNLCIDDKFESFYSQAKAAGLKVGVFFFSQAINNSEAVEEANYVLQHISGKQIDYPVTFDWEHLDLSDARTNGITNAQINSFAGTFCSTISSAGYRPIIYYSKTESQYTYEASVVSSYDLWLADYSDEPDASYRIKMWQFTNQGTISGISGDADIDLYLD